MLYSSFPGKQTQICVQMVLKKNGIGQRGRVNWDAVAADPMVHSEVG